MLSLVTFKFSLPENNVVFRDKMKSIQYYNTLYCLIAEIQYVRVRIANALGFSA